MKGETCKYPYKAETPCDFNPRTHEGCDYPLRVLQLMFVYFNPRTHEGGDMI